MLAIRVLLIASLLGLWQAVGSIDEFIGKSLSNPVAVVQVLTGWLVTGPVYVYPDVVATLVGMLAGLGLGILGAVLLLAIVASSPLVARACSWVIAGANAAPKVALIPLLILWFGIGPISKIVFVASVVGFMIFYNLYSGLLGIAAKYYDNTRMLGASRFWQLRKVTIPALIGWFAASLRASAAYALLATVVVEYMGSDSGIGRQLASNHASLRTDEVIAGVMLVGILAMIIDRVITIAERRLRPWLET
ncbi:MAG: ABC transporter permease [Leucobacter sp.]